MTPGGRQFLIRGNLAIDLHGHLHTLTYLLPTIYNPDSLGMSVVQLPRSRIS